MDPFLISLILTTYGHVQKNMKKPTKKITTTVQALKVNQWLTDWDKVEYDKKSYRRQPEKFFYVFSLSAKQLRALSGVNRRELKKGLKRSSDLGIQRAHEKSRSENIAEYIKYGYPWSDLSNSQRKEEYNDLRKPGWLPTAIVINILTKDDKRSGGSVASQDLITINNKDGSIVEIILPAMSTDGKWEPQQKHPLEIIDGQHRLLAFSEDIDDNYELPVVAFYGLDLSWQAYLFWTINIKPKRINPSLAFDLYPLLRTEDWLERFEGHKVYKEARAQEIIESLWSESISSWYQRINMLGESGGEAAVTQAALIRALLKTYIKSSEGKGIKIGGLFGAPVGKDEMTIPWNRNQQSALLIYLWNSMEKSINKTNSTWAKKLRETQYKRKVTGDVAFSGPHTLLNNDQGISVFLNITNDLLYLEAEELKLKDWQIDLNTTVSDAVEDLKKNQKHIIAFIDEVTSTLSTFDWRSSGAEKLTDNERIKKLSLRGGSGYREFRRQLLKHLLKHKNLAPNATIIYKTLGFDKDTE